MIFIKNQDGFFAMLLVAITSFALWSTMSTMYIYSANKSENLAKIKETVDMYGIMSDFAVEVQHSFFRHYIENDREIDQSKCPSGYKLCPLDAEGSSKSPRLCHKATGNEKCKICLTNFHGQVVQTGEGYCAGVTGFSGDDVFGDCGKDNILCASLAINANDKSNPPNTRRKLRDCTSCFVQPLKIYLDISPSTPATPTTLPPTSTCAQRLNALHYKSCKVCADPSALVDPQDKTDGVRCDGMWTCCSGTCLPQPTCTTCWNINTCRVWTPNFCDGITPRKCTDAGQCGGSCNRALNQHGGNMDVNVIPQLDLWDCSRSIYCGNALHGSGYTEDERLEFCCTE